MKTILFTIAFSLAGFLASAQLKGSGKTITKTYNYQNFDKLIFIGFNDDITVEVGKGFSVSVVMKTDNEKKLSFGYKETEHELTLKVKPATGKELYDERDTFKIKITMPEISVLTNTGNSDIIVDGIIGRYFRAESKGNGNVVCKGSIDELDIEKLGNGDIIAKDLKAKKAKIISSGNGNVTVNVSEEITAQNVGNGDVKNIGKAKFDNNSKKTGNGNLINL